MFDPFVAFTHTIRAWHVFLVTGLAIAFAAWSYFDTSGSSVSTVRLQRSVHAIITLPVMIVLLAFMIFLFRQNQFGAAASFPSVTLIWLIFAALAVVGFGIGDIDFPYLLVGAMALASSLIMSAMICAWLALGR